MTSDSSLVDEIRQRRHEISERFGHDLRKFCQHIMEAQQKHKDRLVDQVTVVKSDPPDKKLA